MVPRRGVPFKERGHFCFANTGGILVTNQTIGIEMQDGLGALQRLLLLLGQRNIVIQHLTVQTAPEERSMVAHVGIEGDPRRAEWVMRQLFRHKGVNRVYRVESSEQLTWMEVEMPPHQELHRMQGVTVLEEDQGRGRYRVTGCHSDLTHWVQMHEGKIAAVSATGLWPRLRHTDPVRSVGKLQGGMASERKVILRRQRRSRVVSR